MTIALYVYCCVHRRTVPLSQATMDPLTGLYVCYGCAGAKVAY